MTNIFFVADEGHLNGKWKIREILQGLHENLISMPEVSVGKISNYFLNATLFFILVIYKNIDTMDS